MPEPAVSEEPVFSRSHNLSQAGKTGDIRAAIAIFLLALAMHLPWLGLSPVAGTEGHRIFPADAMVKTGWWSVPMLFDKPLLSKPPLHHWLIALSEMIAGTGNVFVWRLPSAINGAAVCGVACWFGVRWFGRVAGWISGFCAIGLITIWGQAHVADIDATNTLAAALTALCGIELFIASPWHGHPARVGGVERRATSAIENLPPHHAGNTVKTPMPRERGNQDCANPGWTLLAGASLAAMLMTKGPGGLPIVIGVWMWALIATRKGQRSRLAASARFWLPWFIAAAVFVCWALTVRHALAVRGMPMDWEGVQEGSHKVHAGSVTGLLKSLFSLAPQLVGFALPVSIALPLYFHPEVREELGTADGPICRALVFAVLLSWGVCVLTAMDNPRYAYPTLIPLCPLAGAIAVAANRGAHSRKVLQIVASTSVVLFVVASVVLAAMGWPTSWGKPLLAGTVVVELAVAGWTLWRFRDSFRAAWGLALLAILTIIPFSIHEQLARIANSGIGVAPIIERIVGVDGVVAAEWAVLTKPEAFYYARVKVHVYRSDFKPSVVPQGVWVVLDQNEHKRWLAAPDIRLEKDQLLCRWGPFDYFIAWYANR